MLRYEYDRKRGAHKWTGEQHGARVRVDVNTQVLSDLLRWGWFVDVDNVYRWGSELTLEDAIRAGFACLRDLTSDEASSQR
jgi:hypothetical protein